MKTAKALFVGLSALMLVMGSGCASNTQIQDNPEIVEETAVSSTTEPSPPLEHTIDTVELLSSEICQIVQERASQALATTFALEADAPFTDPISGETGLGCSLTATGTEVDFSNPRNVLTNLANAFDGWTEQASYQADGPTGAFTGLTSDMGLMLIGANWEPVPDGQCPSDQPISACNLEPEQKLYTVQITVAEGINQTTIEDTNPITAEAEVSQTADDPEATKAYEPVSLEVCQMIQATASQALTTTFTLEASAPFTDELSGETGLGCRLTATGTGVDFPDSTMFVFDLPNAFSDWTEQLSYQAGGPTGMATGLTSHMGLMLIYAGWEPVSDVECPADQPISACDLKPEKMLYTIEIQVAQK